MHSRPLCMGLVCSLLLLATTPILAQDKKLPEAKQILAQHLKMIGGQENIAKIKSLETEGKLTIRGTGLGGTIKVTNEEGGRFLQVTEIAGIGREVVGSDGKVSWNSSAINGTTKLLEGQLAEQMSLRTAPIQLAEYSKIFDSMECTGSEKFDGVDCYVVKSTKTNWKPVLDYFEKSTGLHRGTREMVAVEQGEFESVTTYKDYRDVEGVKFSFASATTIGPQVMEFQIASVKLNPKIDSKLFDLPEKVKELKK